MIGDPSILFPETLMFSMKQQDWQTEVTFIIDPDGVIQYVEVSAENVGRNARLLLIK